MIIEHRNTSPTIDPTATISPSAVISGDVTIGAEARVLAGAVITSEGAPVYIGARSIVMEHAVIRGAGKHPCLVSDHVLIGPHAHVSGAKIESGSFIATGAAIFNGAEIGEGCLVAVHGIVHINTRCVDGTIVPIAHIAVGDPAQIFPPERGGDALVAVGSQGFTRIVFGFDSGTLSNADATRALCDIYSNALARHASDRLVKGSDSVGSPRI